MPINKSAKLARNLFNKKDVKRLPTRDGYGHGVLKIGTKNNQVVVLCADLIESTRSHWFKEKFPERYVELGVAEQNLVAVAAGMAIGGKIPYITSYATFSPGRNNEQIRTLACISDLPIKVIGSHAGVSVGPDGATHQALEDIALMRVLPRMTVLVPCDAVEAEKATITAARINGPVYVRLAREKTPVMTTSKTSFKPGKANIFWRGSDVTIIACGPLVHEALLAAKVLESKKIKVEVINNSTIKPLDEKTILSSVRKTKAVVTVEEHQVNGGLGSAIAELLGKKLPTPIEMIGLQDRFGESGEPEELLKHFKLINPHIIQAVKKVIRRKR
ncbi:MAG: transketolase [Parcubacteria group bacterium]|nr:transketolase [Parcubacteria group bacterium]|tara:strand:- start:5832 stop:6824 length:993 start_codon:yes stop_codon:yes gene_type:complete